MYHAIDPGGGTGICSYEPGSAIEKRFKFETLWLLREPRPHRTLQNWLLFHVIPEDVVICEKFEFRKDEQKRDKIDYSAAEYVGVIKAFCQSTQRLIEVGGALVFGPQLIMRGSSNIGNKTFWSEDKLKALGKVIPGLYRPGREHRHERSALQHMLGYITFDMGDDQYVKMLKGRL